MRRTVLRRLAAGAAGALAVLAAAAPPAVAAPPPSCAVGVFLSGVSDRSPAEPLGGQRVLGDVFVFAESAGAELASVTFTLTAPDGTVRTAVERHEGFDLATTGPDGTARPLRTTELPDGEHTVQATWTYASGSAGACAEAGRTATRTFTVDNSRSCAVGFYVSDSPDRRDARPLDGQRLTGDAFVFLDAVRRPRQELSDLTAVLDTATFVVQPYNGPGRVLEQVETYAPFDLRTTAADGRARALRTSLIAPGEYTAVASFAFKDETIFGCGDSSHGTAANFTIGAPGV